MPIDLIDTDRIKKLREKLGLSMEEAAKKSGMTGRQQWHQIESGGRRNIELATLDRMARTLGVKAKDLLK